MSMLNSYCVVGTLYIALMLLGVISAMPWLIVGELFALSLIPAIGRGDLLEEADGSRTPEWTIHGGLWLVVVCWPIAVVDVGKAMVPRLGVGRALAFTIVVFLALLATLGTLIAVRPS